MNNAAVDGAINRMHEVKVPAKVTSKIKMPPVVPADAPEFVQTVTAEMMAMRGDALPVSKMPWTAGSPTGTTQYEKRNIAVEYPDLAAGVVPPVRHVLVGLPARDDSHQGL